MNINDFDWKELVRKLAPMVGTALGGPLAGAATQAVSQVLLGKSDGSEDEIMAAAAAAGPDTLMKLRQMDNDFKIKMKELGLKEEDLYAQDRANARGRAIAQNDKSPIYIGIIILCIWGFVNIFLLMTPKAPVVSEMVLGRILGMIDAVTLAVIYFIYGSSSGSQKKDVLQAQRDQESQK